MSLKTDLENKSDLGVMGRITRPLPDITPTRMRPIYNRSQLPNISSLRRHTLTSENNVNFAKSFRKKLDLYGKSKMGSTIH